MPPLDRNLIHRFGLLLVILLVGLALSLSTDTFLSVANFTNVARQISINGILAVGVTFVLLTAGVDLSLGSVVALSGVACATFAHPGEYSVFVPIAVGLLTGTACGLVNGVLVTRGGVAPFIVTLGMMTIARGLALIFSGGRPVANMSNELTALAGDIWGIPIPDCALRASRSWLGTSFETFVSVVTSMPSAATRMQLALPVSRWSGSSSWLTGSVDC